MGDDLSRYRAMIQALAERALGMAVDAAPHRAAPGQRVFSLIEMKPAARTLLGARGDRLNPPPTDPGTDFVDGHGHSRPVYRCLAFHLYARAGCPTRPAEWPPTDDVSLRLWRQVVAPTLDGVREIEAVVGAHDSSLHARALDDPLDFWTYRELVGLHALHLLAQRHQRGDWGTRIAQVTAYHQDHTQPDYTTYQPWGLAAFLSNPETTWFAEQQLHDVETHLRTEGGPGALLPALLLADAFASISS